MPWVVSGALGAMALCVFTLAACSSLNKATLEKRLLGLSKNAPAREVGLRRMPLTVTLHGRTQEVELVYLFVPSVTNAPTAAPVVLVHGTPGSLLTWVPTIFGVDGNEGLRAHRDVYAIEVMGHGMAHGDGAPYTFESCAQFVEAALRALALEPVHLVGNSYGGEFVWRTGLNAPELVRSLTLMHASGYARKDNEWLPEEVVMRENRLAKYGWLLNSRTRVQGALEPHFRVVPQERTEEMFLLLENASNWKAMIDLVLDENGSRQSEIHNIAAPTLVLWGAREVAYPLETFGKRFEADIPRATLMVLPDTGHYPQEEHPTLLSGALESFFETLEKAAREE